MEVYYHHLTLHTYTHSHAHTYTHTHKTTQKETLYINTKKGENNLNLITEK